MTFEITDELVEHCAERLYSTYRSLSLDPLWYQLHKGAKGVRLSDAQKILEFAVESLEAEAVSPAENSEQEPSDEQIEAWMQAVQSYWARKNVEALDRVNDLKRQAGETTSALRDAENDLSCVREQWGRVPWIPRRVPNPSEPARP